MSLSRPARFPLLKLPFLCIESVIKSWDTFDIICFALLSKRMRQIVKHLKIPLNNIKIYMSNMKWISFANPSKMWHFMQSSRKGPLVFQKDVVPLYTSKTDNGLESFFDESDFIALKMAMEFLNEVFKCSVQTVEINGDNFPESGDIGVRSSVNLRTNNPESHSHASSQKLNLLLENLKVTGTCSFEGLPGPDFHCDPKLLKCRRLDFWSWPSYTVTRGILMQLEVPQLCFERCWPSEEDIVSFVTQWFHSDNRKFEYLEVEFRNRKICWEKLQMKELNPLPFSERTRVPPSESLEHFDFSKGLEIVRHDGLQATIHVDNIEEEFMFYIWHDQSAITQY